MVAGRAGAGVLLQLFSARIESLLARLTPAADPDRLHRMLTRAPDRARRCCTRSRCSFPFPWPHRFHLVLVVLGALIWLSGRLLGRSESLRRVVMRMLPETGGRGLWRSTARRRLIEGLLPEGAEERLFEGTTRVILPACEIASGRMCYFVNAGPGLTTFEARPLRRASTRASSSARAAPRSRRRSPHRRCRWCSSRSGSAGASTWTAACSRTSRCTRCWRMAPTPCCWCWSRPAARRRASARIRTWWNSRRAFRSW